MKKVKMIGRKFGRLLVLEEDKGKTGGTYYKCRCDCGQITSVRGQHLRSGAIRSCGCLQAEARVKHGKSKTPEYRAYYNMLKRCYYEKDSAYGRYGGRGISVCDRWRESFENFLSDVGQRPGRGYSLDRIDPNGNYDPENCRWATLKTQSHNQRTRSDSPVGIRGVVLGQSNGSYIAQIYADGKTHHLGTFHSVKDAAEARSKGESEFWKEGEAG